MTIFDRTMRVIERTLDLRGARHQVIAANVANEETPAYRAKDMRFQESLASAVRGRPPIVPAVTHSRHVGGRGDALSRVTGRVVETGEGDAPLDANTVNFEFEMAKLSDNAMQYNTAATVMSLRLRQLISAIRDVR